MGKIIVVFILLILGGFMMVCTKLMIRFQVWIQRALMGAQYIPSPRTYMVMRIVGGVLAIIAISIAVGFLNS